MSIKVCLEEPDDTGEMEEYQVWFDLVLYAKESKVVLLYFNVDYYENNFVKINKSNTTRTIFDDILVRNNNTVAISSYDTLLTEENNQ